MISLKKEILSSPPYTTSHHCLSTVGSTIMVGRNIKSTQSVLIGAATASIALTLLFAPHQAMAIPSFSAQTNQPCSACHVGSYGPQLKPYGRDFKLGGYTSSDRPDDNIVDNWYERFTTAAWASFNRTNKDMPPSPGGVGYGPNDNFSFDQAAVYFGGRITPSIGGIQELSYDGAERKFFWEAMDFRYSHDGELFGEDATYGLTLGNQLGNTSPWNSTPPNAFPYNASRIVPTPQGTLVDDSLNGQIMGPGAFIMWNDLVYADASLYLPLNHNVAQAVGNTLGDSYISPIPFWHLALQKEFDHHQQYAQIGTFGTTAERQPGGDQTTGQRDRITDIAVEANYQWMADLHNMLSTHATYIHEGQDLNASQALYGTKAYDYLNVFRADATYTINDTWVPSVQYFKVMGSKDVNLYGGSTNGDDYITSANPNGSPNSEGVTMELAYVPFGKPDSPFLWGNARLALQYTAYTEFNGTAHNASDNNTLFLNLSMHLAPLVPVFSHSTTAQ